MVVDNRVAFIGGLDLCIGRFDNHQHLLSDEKRKLFVGKEYYNPDIKSIKHLNRPFNDRINRKKLPRLPWHDLHAKLEGKSVGDVHFNFAQRWNFAIGKICFFIFTQFTEKEERGEKDEREKTKNGDEGVGVN